MRPVACVVVILVACSHPGGLELEVQPLDGVTSARVYLGTTQVPNVNTLSVPFDQSDVVQTTSTDQVFLRAYENDLDVGTFKDGHPLDFELTTTMPMSFGAILVVGYDAGGSAIATDLLTGISVTGDQLLQITVPLTPIDATEQLFLWGSDRMAPPSDAECAGLVGPDSAAFIVASGDTDCDGWGNHDTAHECDPHYWNRTIANPADGSCLELTSGGACMLGGDGVCQDGVGNTITQTCSIQGSTTCTPTSVCARCADGSDAYDCMLADANNMLLGYSCAVATAPAGCSALIPMPSTGGVKCEPPAAGNQTGLAGSGDTTFMPQLDLGSGVTVSLDVGSDCTVSLSTMGVASSTEMVPVLLRVDLANGNSLVTAIELTLTGDTCSNDATCSTMVPDPALTACLAGWGSAVDTNLRGLSPTLTPTMDEMLFISEEPADANQIVRSLFAGGMWSPPQTVTLVPPPTKAIALHLQDATTLWVVDGAQGTLSKYARPISSDAWTQVFALPVASFDQPINAFAPDTMGSDSIVATQQGDMYELAGSGLVGVLAGSGAGSGSGTVIGSFITAGQTPFLTDDDLTIWYSAASSTNGNVAIYTMSRPSKDVPFPQVGVELTELGDSTVAQSPWVSQLAASYLTIMYYASEAPSGSDMLPHIYSVTR